MHQLFLGVASVRLMTNDTQDMGLTFCLINGIAHGFTVNRQALIVDSELRVPVLQRVIQAIGFEADSNVSERCARRNLTRPITAAMLFA